MAALTLISTYTCPYVQRAIIALKEKNVAFDVVYVDLSNKPDWFLAVSPLGKVPVLKVARPGQEDAIVFESVVILEYLEETADGVRLHPADPLERAQHRSWMEFGSNVQADFRRLRMAGTAEEFGAAKKAVSAKFARLEDVLGDGPFFAGASFSFVDAVFAPAFRQLGVMESVAPLGVADGYPKVLAWAKALAARPSVKAAVPGNYTDLFFAQIERQNAAFRRLAA